MSFLTRKQQNTLESANKDKSLIVYKKVRILKDGNTYPLFIDNKKPFIIGKWQQCEYHPKKGFAPRSIRKNDNGDEIGGWHSCPKPEASWIADELKSGEKRVWLECEAKDVVEYKRPQGIWYLSEWIKPLRILSKDDIKEILKNE